MHSYPRRAGAPAARCLWWRVHPSLYACAIHTHTRSTCGEEIAMRLRYSKPVGSSRKFGLAAWGFISRQTRFLGKKKPNCQNHEWHERLMPCHIAQRLPLIPPLPWGRINQGWHLATPLPASIGAQAANLHPWTTYAEGHMQKTRYSSISHWALSSISNHGEICVRRRLLAHRHSYLQLGRSVTPKPNGQSHLGHTAYFVEEAGYKPTNLNQKDKTQ